MARSGKSIKKQYIFDLDLIRAFTAFTVVAIHALSNASFVISGAASYAAYNLFIHMLHYNREVFVFMTALLLSYLYLDRQQFNLKQFYVRRVLVIFLPYALWSSIYVVIHNHFTSIGAYSWLLIWNILTGNASPQLYYIIMTLQLYALLPVFLWFIRKVRNYPWQTLAISLVVQLVMLYLDFHFLERGNLRANYWFNVILEYQDRVLPAYIFFVILGGLAGAYVDQLKTFLDRHGRQVLTLALVGAGAFAAFYYYEIDHLHYSVGHAVTVLQPSVVLYSIAAIIFFGWLANIWARHLKFYGLLKILAETSFGIYFVQFIVLQVLMNRVFSHWTGLPAAIFVPSFVISSYVLSAAVSYALYKIPHLSWTIGKPVPVPSLKSLKNKLSPSKTPV